MIRGFIVILLTILCSVQLTLNCIPILRERHNIFAREHSVFLEVPGRGSCSGVKIISPKGKFYILSAAHCALMLDEQHQSFRVTTEDKKVYSAYVISVNPSEDLLLLTDEKPTTGVFIARQSQLHEQVHTMTHGLGHANYRTDGEILETDTAQYAVFDIISEAQKQECEKLPNTKIYSDFNGSTCVATLVNQVTTARVSPGSSGGMVLNDEDELVGIVSGVDSSGQFSAIVPLSTIRLFLADR